MILRIEPRDPLIVRDGRPFSAFPGAKVRGYPFPPPQVVAGATRGRVGLLRGWTRANERDWRNLQKTLCVEGPLLASAEDGKLYFPAPLDALLMKETPAEPGEPMCPETDGPSDAKYKLYRLKPRPKPEEALTNLPEGLLPIYPAAETGKGKPETMPAFWDKDVFFKWLLGDPEKEMTIESPASIGLQRLPEDYRTHVKIKGETQTAEEHMLFETQGLEFTRSGGAPGQLSTARRLALLVRLSGDASAQLDGVAPLGGERRLALWQTVGDEFWPAEPPEELVRKILEARAARIVLVTPTDFNGEDGEMNPRPFLPPQGSINGAPVKAAAVGRPLTVSGWDMLENKPKPSRRLAPAGSVYFVDLSELSEDQVAKWVKETWMQTLREQPEQSRCDGYGLAVLGVWRKHDATEG